MRFVRDHKHFSRIKTNARNHARRARNKIKARSSHSSKDLIATRKRNIAVIGITPPNMIATLLAQAIPATTGVACVTQRITQCYIVPSGNSLSRARQLTRIRLGNDKQSSVRAAPQYNFQGAKRTLTTAFNLERWNFYLKDYYNDVIVTAILQYGWPISHSADQLPCSTLQNHPSARQHPSLLRDYIAQELKYKAVIGPFQCNPFSTDCLISPLQSVAKRDSSIPRVVYDLSFPPGQSVNDGIARDEYLSQPFHLRLPGVDRLVEFINSKGPGCLVFKKDLKRAYRQIPVDPHDYHLLGMCIDGQFYFHSVMPFGLRSATLACQRTTKAVSYILNEEGILVDVYIDDFYGAETQDLVDLSFDRMTQLFSGLGLQSSPDKDTHT